MEQKRLLSVPMASGINSYPGLEYNSSSFSEKSNKKFKCILNKINLKKYFNSKEKYHFDDGGGSKLNTCLNFFKRRPLPIFYDDRSIFSNSDSSDVRSLSDFDVSNITNKYEETDAFAERIQHSINGFSRKNNTILIEKGKYSENDMHRVINFLRMEYCSLNKNAKGKEDASLYKNVKVIANDRVLDGKECYEIKIKKFFTMNERDKEKVDQTLGILSDVLKGCAEKKYDADLLNKITGMKYRDSITLLDYVKDLNLNKTNDVNEGAVKKYVAENNSELQSESSSTKDSESINVSGGIRDLKNVGVSGGVTSYYKNNSGSIFERGVESTSQKYVDVLGKRINIELGSLPGILIASAGNKKEYKSKYTEHQVEAGEKLGAPASYARSRKNKNRIIGMSKRIKSNFAENEELKKVRKNHLDCINKIRFDLRNVEMDAAEESEVIAKESSFVINYNIGIHEEFKMESIRKIGELHGMDPILERFLWKVAPAA